MCCTKSQKANRKGNCLSIFLYLLGLVPGFVSWVLGIVRWVLEKSREQLLFWAIYSQVIFECLSYIPSGKLGPSQEWEPDSLV